MLKAFTWVIYIYICVYDNNMIIIIYPVGVIKFSPRVLFVSTVKEPRREGGEPRVIFTTVDLIIISVTSDLSEGEVCNTDYDMSYGLICEHYLVCDTCPEDENSPDVCKLPVNYLPPTAM